VDAGDPYQAQIEHCVKMITKRLPEDVEAHLSYQSRVGPVEWLRPATDEKLQELGISGVRNLVVVPISFVSEHVETLEELDIEYREVADEAGITGWRRAPALNTDKAFIDDLAAAIIEALQTPIMTVNEVLTNDLSVMKPQDELSNRMPLQHRAEENSTKVPPQPTYQERLVSDTETKDALSRKGSPNRMTFLSPSVGNIRIASMTSPPSLSFTLPDSRESAFVSLADNKHIALTSTKGKWQLCKRLHIAGRGSHRRRWDTCAVMVWNFPYGLQKTNSIVSIHRASRETKGASKTKERIGQ
jgi:hypothetical protein